MHASYLLGNVTQERVTSVGPTTRPSCDPSPSWMKYLPPWAQCEPSPVLPLQLDLRSRGLLNDYDYFHWKDLNEILGGSKYQPH